MALNDNTSVENRTITAFFDTRAAADKAVADLARIGIPNQHVSVTGGSDSAATTATSGNDVGFWESLKDMFLPEEDRHSYSEGLRRGGYLVSVRAEEANYTRVLDILDTDGSVNMDERETQWKSEGWTGYTGAPARAVDTISTRAMDAPAVTADTAYETDTAARAAAMGVTTGATPDRAAQVDAGRDEVIPLYEEQLRVGKRDVEHGRVRLRSYVVERAVNEQVSLHSEHVEIDRKPVDRPVSVTDAMFQDRVIEAEERSQEAVISKEARVKEEITLRRTGEDRVQNVTDKVRSTEVEIEDGRSTGTAARFSAATDSARIVEHMDVIASDGAKIGTVDHCEGPDRIKLAKTTSPDGQHHYVPLSSVDHVDAHVHLNKTAAAVKAIW